MIVNARLLVDNPLPNGRGLSPFVGIALRPRATEDHLGLM
jgi:hypothetical protein